MFNANQRGSQRLDVAIDARCRLGMASSVPVTVHDISTGGCRIALRGHALHVGDTVILRTELLEGLRGQVRWVELDRAGIRFESPLYGPVVEHLHRACSGFLQSMARPVGPRLRMVA